MDICCICLDNQKNNITPYQCDHHIHYECFKSWPKYCPLCKSKPKDLPNKIKYSITNKIKYPKRLIQNTKVSEYGNNYEKIQFKCGNWYDVQKGYYSEILFENGWQIVSREFLDELNRF